MEEDVTKEEIIRINREIAAEFGNVFGMINESNLDFLMAKIRNIKDTFRKAAEILYGIARGHPFLDGNKRTAFQTTFALLLRNGISLKVDPAEGEAFMMHAATEESLTVREVEIWIRRHSDEK